MRKKKFWFFSLLKQQGKKRRKKKKEVARAMEWQQDGNEKHTDDISSHHVTYLSCSEKHDDGKHYGIPILDIDYANTNRTIERKDKQPKNQTIHTYINI